MRCGWTGWGRPGNSAGNAPWWMPAASPQQGGEATGPNPVDRGKAGTTHHLITEGQGLPMAVRVTKANRQESVAFEELVDAVPPIRGPRGQRRKRPDKLHADKGFDKPHCRRFLHRRGIRVRIARVGIESKGTLGRHRWVIERTFAWLRRFRRLSIRYEQRLDIHQAFLTLGCALICFRALERS